jgi:sugar phosphate isomerase/epimerase
MARITAISSLGWAHYTLYEALPRMAARGFSRIEIASFATYCFHFNFGSPTPGELSRMCVQLGLTPIALNYYTEFYDASDAANVDAFVGDWQRKLPHLRDVGIGMMTMGFGARNDHADQERQLENAVRGYNRISRMAESCGVKMLLEVPHLYGIMPRPSQVLWVFDRIDSGNVGALVDCSHWGIIDYDLDEFLDALGDRLWHVHLRDSTGPDTADRKQQLELTPGSGVVDFEKFARALDRVNYAGDVSIEFEYRDLTLDAIEREYDAGLTYLQQHGWELPQSVQLQSIFADAWAE